jgi:transposase
MTKGQQARLMAWRLRVLPQAASEQNVARVCGRFGISRKSFYKWKRRHTEYGDAGLGDRPRTPHRSPSATASEVVSKILYLRQHYHFDAGRIAAYLRRFHQIVIVNSSVHRILTRHGMPRLPANQKYQPHGKRWQRYEKPQPGHRLQLDVKFLERIAGTRRRCIRSPRSMTARGFASSRFTMRVTNGPPSCHRRGAPPPAVPSAHRTNRQRRRIPVTIPLAP